MQDDNDSHGAENIRLALAGNVPRRLQPGIFCQPEDMPVDKQARNSQIELWKDYEDEAGPDDQHADNCQFAIGRCTIFPPAQACLTGIGAPGIRCKFPHAISPETEWHQAETRLSRNGEDRIKALFRIGRRTMRKPFVNCGSGLCPQ
ncbi:hypothetical protein [Rhizobium hainanense]|uniref:hypothetical protein n=1 Tax=Rhizobium hainanense TaxID=52131 RepID=UPI001FCD0122|nr:hypothetical protein [Rhizobium hainanense]